MSLEQHLSGIRDALYKEMEQSKRIVFGGLLENPPINYLPESIFVNYFLPHFLGDGNNPNWVMEWISIAGTPMAEVAIFKDGTNEVLFTVPGILYTNNLFLNRKRGDLSDIFIRYEQISNNLPVKGLSFLVEALNSKNSELLNKINVDDVKRRWLGILNRYNVMPVNATNSTTSASNTSIDDYFEF